MDYPQIEVFSIFYPLNPIDVELTSLEQLLSYINIICEGDELALFDISHR